MRIAIMGAGGVGGTSVCRQPMGVLRDDPDLRATLEAGNRLEAPWLAGAVARMGAATGIATPVNSTLYAALKPYCAGAAR